MNVLKNYGILVLGLLFLSACDPLESGDPPVINGFTVIARNDTQLEVSWKPSDVSDDLLEASSLHYGIWYAKTSDGLNTASLGTPNIVTKEGVLSYSILGLTASTSYDVIVRVADRGNVFSTNTSIKTVSTVAIGSGRFATAVTQSVSENEVPKDLIAGRAVNATDDIGFVYSNVIDWYTRNTSGGGLTPTASTTVSNATEAYLVPYDSTIDKDDLLVVTTSGLKYFLNKDTFDASVMVFEGVPATKTLAYRIKSNVLDVVSYVATDGTAWIYKYQPDERLNAFPFVKHRVALGDAKALFSMANLNPNSNADGNYDLVYLSGDKIYTQLATNDTLESFDAAEDLDSLTTDDVGEGTYVASLFVEKGDADDFFDIILFVHNEGKALTRVFFYPGIGDGTFGTKRTADYGFHSFVLPLMADAGGDGRVDFIAAQTASNNVAVSFGPFSSDTSMPDYTTPDYFGIDGTPSFAIPANLDGNHGPELVVYDSLGKKLHLLYANQSQ